MSTSQTQPIRNRLLDPFRAAGAVVLTLAAVFVALGFYLLAASVGLPVPVEPTETTVATFVFTALLVVVVVGMQRATPAR